MHSELAGIVGVFLQESSLTLELDVSCWNVTWASLVIMLERHVEILDGLAGMIASSGSACGTCRSDDKHFSFKVSRNYFVPFRF